MSRYGTRQILARQSESRFCDKKTSTLFDATEGIIILHKCTVLFQTEGLFSNSALPFLIVAYLTVPDASVEANGGVVPVAAISLISSLILRVTASCTAPGGLSAISLTSLSVRTSLMRDARDWRRSVVGPSKRRKSYSVTVSGGKKLSRGEKGAYSVGPDCSPQPGLQCVVGCS